MDSIQQINAHKNDRLHLLIEDQVREAERGNLERIMRSEQFSIEKLDDDVVEADTELSRRLREYEEKQERYSKQRDELEQGRVTEEGEIEYQYHLIQAEQNRMKWRLLKAAVLDRQHVAKRARAEGLAKIISFRQQILEKCAVKSILWYFHKKQLEIERAEYDRVMDEMNLDILVTAALDRIKTERAAKRQGADDEQGLIREFLDADFSEQALQPDYVIQNLDTCMHNVELLRRIEAVRLAHRRNPRSVDDIFTERKFEAVREYANAVESVLWEYGLTIDDTTLQVRKIDESDGGFAARRQAYQKEGAIRFSLGARKYRHTGKDAGAVPTGQQEDSVPAKVEDKLGRLETMLGMQGDGDNVRIMYRTRSVGSTSHADPGDVIRASDEQAQGRMDDRLIKLRIFSIYKSMCRKIGEHFPTGMTAFQSLGKLVLSYTCTNRNPFENRREIERKETKALIKLKTALMNMPRDEGNLCGMYADLLLGLITEESNGYLDVPQDQIHPVDDQNIALSKRGHFWTSMSRTFADCTNRPLFTHRPNIKDIEQGGLGDCYLLAGLVSLVVRNAEAIMNVMRDNGDGTVTVRFMQEENDGSGNQSYTPHFVTVRKTIPVSRIDEDDTYSRGAFWIKMMEKAYAASGFHILAKMNEERKRRGEASRTAGELESSIVQGKQRVGYNDIEGGRTGLFISLLLGKESEEQYLDKNRADVGADMIGRLLPAINEPEWDRDPTRRYGNDSADSIVYEYIKRVFGEPLTDTFLHLKKPTDDGPEKADYERQRRSLRFLVRPCMCQLDIIAAIMREKKIDILRMRSEAEIEEWYTYLKKSFVDYKSGIETRHWFPSSKGKIIAGVRKNYWREEIRTFFDAISADNFQVTLDILKERHLALFRRNQHIGQGAGSEDFGQYQRGYYTYGDHKLYERISKRLKAGAYIAFGTRELSQRRTGLNGESESGGMVGTHAYAVIDTCSKIIGGEERLFFVIMNPWARKGVVYDVSEDGLKERAVKGISDGEKEEGVFLLELKKFAEIATHWDAVAA